jgi:hypothetical protein
MMVGDLKKQLRDICHEEQRLGLANVQAWYYKAYQEVLPNILGAVSNRWRTSPRIPHGARRLAMAYHAGTLHTQAVAYREKRASSPACLLCGGLDTRQHAVSGCPRLGGMAIERHHGATRMIVKELALGRFGAGVFMMDAGRKEKREAEGIQAHTSIPQHILPSHLRDAARRKLLRTLKPDALVRIKEKVDDGGTRDVYVVLEVKYCKDTNCAEQESRAVAQHARLLELIKAAGHAARQETVLLGVGGTIYKDTLEQLDRLGLARHQAKRLTERLSEYAVLQMQRIIHTRRALETVARKSAGTWAPWQKRNDPWDRGKRKRGQG